MSHFIQLHLLTSYPPANLNRDDLGRPKTAVMGGETRLRISSQSLKRAWRTSEIFTAALQKSHIGQRTKTKGLEIYIKLLAKEGITDKKALEWSRKIAECFGKIKPVAKESKDEEAEKFVTFNGVQIAKRIATSLEIEQLAHISPEENQAIAELIEKIGTEKREPTAEELALLRKEHSAADIALFGRMLASAPKYNMEAAVQVAHAISVHRVVVEDDFFTAVDDLNQEESGAGHMGETEFAAGLFYLYICIDKTLLTENLNNDAELVKKTLAALTEAAVKIAPTGKQNSFASRAYASFILVEKGNQQPRSLSVAFLNPVTGKRKKPGKDEKYAGMLEEAIGTLIETRSNLNQVYNIDADESKTMNALTATGSLTDIIAYVTE